MRLTESTIWGGELTIDEEDSPDAFSLLQDKFRLDIGANHRLYFNIQEWREVNAAVERLADVQRKAANHFQPNPNKTLGGHQI